jgi:nicotinate-nucleotide pyrophosphorylase (carboxylating)
MNSSLNRIIQLALEEDIGLGDVTTDNLIDDKDSSIARMRAKSDLIFCGGDVAQEVFLTVDQKLNIKMMCRDGDRIEAGDEVMMISGSTKSILYAERLALNFVQRLSGIATNARRFADLASRYSVRVCDTRKSTPGFRRLEKYAVKCGGASNHRMSLADAVMIKDNHIMAAGSITSAVRKIREGVSHTAKIEVETATLDEVREAIEQRVDIIMFDNMTPSQIFEAKELVGERAITEVSGSITLDNFESYAKTGVDVISVGALTHSVKAADLSLNLEPLASVR